MRILKAEFQNLNSLAGTWTVDFRHQDFQTDGLFLITGPTGSGKSTLLDAICLALYGRTPRIAPSGSQNEIMTRHTGQCGSEVTFETPKGIFRARWFQQRSNKNPLGKLQPPRHELMESSGKILSDQAKFTKQLVQQYIGLDFDQFERAVLLAQNKFDVFLKSSDEEKSAILEKLTDTSIYSQLSKLAHEKARSAKEKLQALRTQYASFSLPDTQTISLKQNQLDAIDTELTSLDKLQETQQELLMRLERIEKLKARKNELTIQRRELNAEMRAFDPQRLLLASALTAATLEPAYLQLSELRKQSAALGESLRSLASSFLQKKQILESVTSKVETYRGALDKAIYEKQALAPVLDSARIMDASIEEKTTELSRKEQTLKEQMALRDKLAQDAAALGENMSRCHETGARIAEWLNQHKNDEWLEANMSAVAANILQIKRNRENLTRISDQLAAKDNQYKEIELNLADNSKELELSKAAIADCEAIIADLEIRKTQMLAGWTLEGLQQSLREKLIISGQLQSLEEYRKALRKDHPCPLCGSLEHPWANNEGPDIEEMSITCRELSKQIGSIEEYDKSLRAVGTDRTAAISQSERIMERIKGLEDQAALRLEDLEETRERLKSLQKETSELETEFYDALAPLDIAERFSLDELKLTLERRLQAVVDAKQRKDSLDKEYGDYEKKHAVMKESLHNAELGIEIIAMEKQEIEKQLEEIKKERFKLLPGVTVKEKEAALNANIDDARKIAATAENQLAETRKKYDQINGAISANQERREQITQQLEQFETEFKNALGQHNINETEFLEMRLEEEQRKMLENRRQELEARQTRLAALEEECENALKKDDCSSDDAIDKNTVNNNIKEVKEKRKTLHDARGAIIQFLAQYQTNYENAQKLRKDLEGQEKENKKWEEMDRQIGAADGKKFRVFAQSITLDRLLAFANRQLSEINPRYTLRRSLATSTDLRNLELEVIDHYQAGAIRTIKNLSGGETFMASLALALGLSEMAGGDTPLGSLFLDEGFGTLDEEALETAFSAICKLKQSGKLIGVISHVEALKDWIPTQIRVVQNPDNAARSHLFGPGCDGRS